MIIKSRITKESFTEVIPSLKQTDVLKVFERQASDRRKVPYNRRDFFMIAVASGTGTLYHADNAVEVDRPALFFLNPMIPYAWDAKSSHRGGFVCLCTEEFIMGKEHIELLKDFPVFSVGVHPVYLLDGLQLEYIESIFRNMLREFNSDYSHKYDLLHNHLNLIFHEAMKIKPTVEYIKHNASERIAAQFMASMERQFPVNSLKTVLKLKTANDYAQQLSVHVNTLNRAVKEVTGKTTTEQLNDRFINEAKLLLQHTNWTINEIAYSLGYEYPTYFTNFFKKQTGITPNSVRH